jgi:hypothetical protein
MGALIGDADRSSRLASEELGADFVVEPPHHTASVTRVAAILDDKDKLFRHFCLYKEPHAAIRCVRDETIL